MKEISSLAAKLERWFGLHQRALPWRKRYTPYQIWVSEVMLQQTRMEVVLPYFTRFVRRFPDLRALADAPESQVLAAWSGLGYYRRARHLHSAAKTVVSGHGGRVPRDPKALRALPGIGRYTAGAIASVAFNQREPIVDGNVARILARLFAIREPSNSAPFTRRVWRRAAELVRASRSPRMFNQALMEVGALLCRPRNPRCGDCPVSRVCKAHLLGREKSFPRVVAAPEPARIEIPLYVVRDRSGRILMRRESGTLMGEMFHLPHGNAKLLTDSSTSLFQADRYVGSFRHTVTHRRIRFEVWTAKRRTRRRGDAGTRGRSDRFAASPRLRVPASHFTWIDPAALDDVPHPSYVRKALALVG